jgi:hypothetical protein
MSDSKFVKLTLTQETTPLYVSGDEIAQFMPADRYRPGNGSLVILKSGTQYSVREPVDEIAMWLS